MTLPRRPTSDEELRAQVEAVLVRSRSIRAFTRTLCEEGPRELTLTAYLRDLRGFSPDPVEQE